MTNVSPFQVATIDMMSASTAPQMLTTGMSFEEALRAAHEGTNRSFGFDELGMLGHSGAWGSPSESIEMPATPGEPDMEVGAPAAQPSRQEVAQDREPVRAVPGRQAAESADGQEIAAPQPLPSGLTHGSDTVAVRPASLASNYAPTAESVHAMPAAGEATSATAALLARVPMRPRPPELTRFTLIIEDGKARLVVRDFSISEEDRALIEEQADALLESHGLTRAELMLNGSDGSVRRTDRKES